MLFPADGEWYVCAHGNIVVDIGFTLKECKNLWKGLTIRLKQK